MAHGHLDTADGDSRQVSDGQPVVPNLHFLSIPWDVLRACKRFISLPPSDQVVLDGPETQKYFRQDSKLWKALHLGVLSTRWINAALGFYEPQAAKRLSIQPRLAGHSSLLKVQDFLLSAEAILHEQPKYRMASNDNENPCHYNEVLMRQHNCHSHAVECRPSLGSEMNELPSGADKGAKAFLGELLASAEAPDEASACEAKGDRVKSRGRKGKRRKSSRRPDQGPSSHKIAIMRVMRSHHDDPPLEGKQLCRRVALNGVDAVRLAWGEIQEPSALLSLLAHFPDSYLCEVGLCRVLSLPKEWGYSLSELPELGASPDCIIVHCIKAPPDVASQVEEFLETSASNHPPLALVKLVIEAVRFRSLSPCGGPQVPSCENIVVDTLTADECCHYLPYRFPFSVHRENDSVWVRIAEVVEIKSCCPFSLSHKGQQPSEWIYSCSGPRSAVPPMYIAQLQLEMLATGLHSALLVQHSAQQGMHVHRVFRDDQFLEKMVGVLHRFKAEYIKPASQPPPRPKPNLYYESHMYQQLLHRALHLSRVASAVPPWELLNSFELQGPTLDTLLRDPSSTSAAKTVHPVDINPFISS